MAAEARHDAIADRLRGDILRGAYPAGVRLPAERDLAQQLGANRSSVREALRKLEQSGLVQIRHGGGATVRPLQEASLDVVRHLLVLDGVLNRPLLEQLLDVHEMLIVGATRLAVERGSDEQMQLARELLAKVGDHSTPDDEYIDAMEDLLVLIAVASGNLVLQMARRAVNPLFEDGFRDARKRLRSDPSEVAPIVRELDDAVVQRDPTRAENAARQLIRAGRDRALDELTTLARRQGGSPS